MIDFMCRLRTCRRCLGPLSAAGQIRTAASLAVSHRKLRLQDRTLLSPCPSAPSKLHCKSSLVSPSTFRTHLQQIRTFYLDLRSMAEELFVPYSTPQWAKHLRQAPVRKIQLANLPTPIHRWNLPGLPEDVEVFIKRDDMTGSTLTGNKVRKLEFLLADAVSQGCKHVITCGGVQSNHCRSVAVACRQLGLQAHLLLRDDLTDPDSLENNGNVLLNRLSGAKIYFVPRKSPQVTHLFPRMEALSESIMQTSGEKSYIVPVGGTNHVGVWGYISAFQELIHQGVADRFDDVVFACGSGGTAEGLVFGNHLSQSGLKIHGIVVSDDRDMFMKHINDSIQYFSLEPAKAEDIFDAIEGYKGRGYGLARKEEMDFSVQVAQKTGIMTDPTYTGKAVYGLVQELNKNPDRFKGKRILFIHTGGVYGMYDGRLAEWLKNDEKSKANVFMWPEVHGAAPS